MVKGLTQLSAAKASWDSVYSRCCRNQSTLPPDGEGIDPAVGSQGPAGTPSIPVVVGIRLHFHQMVMGLTQLSAAKAQLGLRLFQLL